MTNLNEVYEAKALVYICNATGDINRVGADGKSPMPIENLPLKERNLFQNYWSELRDGPEYVVEYKGNPGLAIGYLFDTSFLEDMLNRKPNNTDMEQLYNAIYDYAALLETDPVLDGADILVGNNTDLDGHELLVYLPYSKRDRIQIVSAYLGPKVYKDIEELF